LNGELSGRRGVINLLLLFLLITGSSRCCSPRSQGDPPAGISVQQQLDHQAQVAHIDAATVQLQREVEGSLLLASGVRYELLEPRDEGRDDLSDRCATTRTAQMSNGT